MQGILSRNLVVLFLLAAAFLTGSTIFCYRAISVLRENQHMVMHTQQVKTTLESIRAALATAEGAQRNYLITGDTDELAESRAAAQQALEDVETLAGLTVDNPVQQQRIPLLREALSSRFHYLQVAVEAYQAEGYAGARRAVMGGAGQQAMNRALGLLATMGEEENALMRLRSHGSDVSVRHVVVTFSLVALLSAGLLGVIVFSVRREIATREMAARQVRTSETRLLLAVEATELGIWEYDPGSGRVQWSDRCNQIFGFPAGARPDYVESMSRLHPEDRERVAETIQEAVQPSSPGAYITEYRLLLPSGQTRWVRARGRSVFEGAGPARRVVRLVGTVMDFTDVRAAQEDLRQARDRAEAANQAKDRFLAVLSHELRTPLTPVLGSVSELEGRPEVPENLRQELATVRRNIELEARLIDDLLDLTRITRGKIQLHPEVVDMHALLTSALQIVGAEVRAKKLSVSTEFAAGRRHVWGDPGRLQQIAWNLLANAVKFTPAGGSITIRTCNVDGRLEVAISDTGIGIDPQILPRLFNAFEQGEQTITRKFGGLGLGLSIAKALVDQHQGQLEARSEGHGRGTTFLLRFETIEPAANGTIAARVEARPGASARLRILLVEDNEDTRRLMGRLLRSFGHTVEAADSVSGALELARRQEFDLLVSDIGLPDGTGWDLMYQLGAKRPGKAIALSGFGMDEDLRKSREAGFLEHITKPVNVTHLKATIERVGAL